MQLDAEINRPAPEAIASPVDDRNSGFASPNTTNHPSYQPSRVTTKEKTHEEIDADNLAQLEQSVALERKRTSELGDAKKRTAALANRRSAMISAKCSGPMQDERLREVSRRLARAESESLRVQSLIAKEAKKHPPGGGQVCIHHMYISYVYIMCVRV